MFDTCGTGGDRSHTFNVSTVAALVVAACGVRVAKHGNRSVSSQCGSADLFEALGVNVAAPPAVVERCLDEAGIAFFFAPTFHPSMRHAAQTRKELGVRTAFNLLGPLTNPAGAARQLVGVPRPELTELVARSLALLGSERAWVVHGADGLDEISTTGYTKVSECRDGAVNTFYLHPADFGLPKAAPEELRGGDAADNARDRARILGGERGAARDIVLLNAGASLFIAGVRRRWRTDIAARRGGDRPRRGGARARQLVRRSQEAAAERLTRDATAAGSARDDRRRDAPRSVEVRASSDRPLAALERERATRAAGRRASRRRCARAGAARHRRVQAPLAVARHPARSTTTPRRIAARLRRRRGGRDLGAHRADVLRWRAGAPRAGARGGRRSRSCARTSSSPTTSCRGGRLGADAALLIVGRPGSTTRCARCCATCGALGLAALVEVHDAEELARAIDAGAAIIGVNSRNLRTLAVDPAVHEAVARALPAA